MGWPQASCEQASGAAEQPPVVARFVLLTFSIASYINWRPVSLGSLPLISSSELGLTPH